jgi:catalase
MLTDMDQQEKKPTTNGTNVADWYNHSGEAKSNDYLQLGNSYRLLTEEAKKELITNIITAMRSIGGPNKEMTLNLQLCHWFRMDMSLGMAVANGLNINMQELMKNMSMG